MKFSATFFYLFAALIVVIPAQVAAGDNDGGDNGGDAGKPQPPSSYSPDRDHPKRPDYDHNQRCDKKPDGDNDGKSKKEVQVLWGQCTSLSLRVSFFAFPLVEGFSSWFSLLFCLGGGYYYYGTKDCPEGSYCRKFSDCKFYSFAFPSPFHSPTVASALFLSPLNERHSRLYFPQGTRNATPTTTKSPLNPLAVRSILFSFRWFEF